jgi:hypothetical protein
LILLNQNLIEIRIDARIEKLLKSPPGSFLGSRSQKDLALCIRKSHGPLVSPFSNAVLTRADSALLLNHKLSDFGIFRDGLDRLCDRWVSDLACHVELIECHRTPRQIDLTAVGDLEGCRRIMEIDLSSHARERHASIHRAGVEKEKA